MPIGEKLLIRPTWEDEYDAGGRKLLHIEPGLAFGTGSHPTTKLCLETLEKYIDENSTVLDIGWAAVFFLSLPSSSEQKVPLALISTRLRLKQRRQMHLKTALTKANSRQFRAICQTR